MDGFDYKHALETLIEMILADGGETVERHGIKAAFDDAHDEVIDLIANRASNLA